MSKVTSPQVMNRLLRRRDQVQVRWRAHLQPVPWLSVGGRFDRVMPNSHYVIKESVLSPKVYFKTAFFSHELVTLQHSLIYPHGKPIGALGDSRPAVGFGDGEWAVLRQGCLYLAASMWW